MACTITSEKDLEGIKAQTLAEREGILEVSPGHKVYKLPRGGCIISTSIGNIQFGMPPETVKDSMNLGLDVPTHYIVPTVKFDPRYGLNVAEFEFPAYFNFFIKKKRVNLICTEQSMKDILVVFQETLLGPKTFEHFRDDFGASFDESAIPDIAKELAFFAVNPFTKEKLTIDTLIVFTLIDPVTKTAVIEGKVKVKAEGDGFIIHDNDEIVAKISDKVYITVENDFKDYDPKNGAALTKVPEKVYEPPLYGVTVLGCSHGFDPKGSTSGYIFWINGRGVMIDPPPFMTLMLKKQGVSPTLIDAVIISHCHADHDAGTFQKILDSQEIQVITTRTIHDSFVRKYSALTGMADTYLKSLFRFRPVKIGQPMKIHGATFKFFYSLHSIPCIGFQCSLNGKSIYFSSDTFYDPEGMQKMVEGGFMSLKRFKSLCENKWNHSLIIHEAGVPPIHTPMKVFVNLPKEVKERLYLVHVAQKDIPEGKDLKNAKTGLENTIVLETQKTQEYKTIESIDLLCSIPIFEDLTIRNARDLLEVMQEEEFKAHDVIVEEQTYGDKFYLIKTGIVKIFSFAANNEFERFMTRGDYFGESAVVGDSMRRATCVAVTPVTLLTVDREDFWMIFGNASSGNSSGILKRLMNLKDSRKSSGFKAILKNTLLSSLSGSQKTQLEVLLKEDKFEKGELLWRKGEPVEKVVIVGQGVLRFIDCKETEMGDFTSGDLIGEMESIIKGGVHRTTLQAQTQSVVFSVKKKEFLHFLQSNPGLNIIFSGLLHAD